MEHKNNQLKIGIMLNYLNMILGNLIPIFYTPIMLSLLGQSEYGLYKLSSSVTSYLSLISLGIGAAITRYLIKAREEQGKDAEERMLGLFVVIFHVIAVLAFIVGTALVFCLPVWYGDALTAPELQRMKILVFLMVCNTALGFSQSPYGAAVSSHERFVFQQCTNIVATCIAPLLNIVMLMLGYASVGMAIASLVVGILSRIVHSVYIRQFMGIRPRYRAMPTHMLRDILTFSFWIFISNVVSQLYNATDTVMMGAVPELATVGVAVYSVGNVFNSIVFSLTTGISSLMSPKVNKMVFSGADHQALTGLAIQVGRLQGLIFSLVVSGFIAFGQPFIRLYAGEGYEDAYWVAILMMMPNMIPLVQSICLSVLVAQNKHKFRALVYLGIAVANVVGTWYLMRIWGIIGAALMTGLALVLGQGIIMNWYYHKKTGLDMIRFWKEVGGIYIAPALLCVAAILLGRVIDYNTVWIMLVSIVVYSVIFLVLNWFFVLNGEEKDFVRNVIRLKKVK